MEIFFEECRCKIPNRGWILVIYQPLAGLQDIWDSDQNV
jgi:hypothetical protein